MCYDDLDPSTQEYAVNISYIVPFLEYVGPFSEPSSTLHLIDTELARQHILSCSKEQ